MFPTSRTALRIYITSSLFLHPCAWTSDPSRYLRPQTGAEFTATKRVSETYRYDTARSAARIATTMGPVHGSASFYDKISSIGSVLGEDGRTAALRLQVIMDFDLTMTAPGSEQCHHMFETSPALSTELRTALRPYIHGQVQVSSPEEWWTRFHGLLVGAGVTREQVVSVVRRANVNLREGTRELLLLLQDLGVPLLIVSAGIRDVIEEILQANGLLLDNVTICANTMIFDEHGTLRAFRETPPWHSRNKHQTAEREEAYFAEHPDRCCVIVVGDKPGDAVVSHGVAPDERCLKIGFFDHSDEHPHTDLPLEMRSPPLPLPTAEPTIASPSSVESLSNEAKGQELGSLRTRDTYPNPCNETSSLRPSRRIIPQDELMSLMHMMEVSAQDRQQSAARGVEDGRARGSDGAIRVTLGLRSTTVEDELATALVGASGRKDVQVNTVQMSDAPGRDVSDSSHADRGINEKDQRQKGPLALELKAMLRVYRERFDVVAHRGHSMDLVSKAVRHLVGEFSYQELLLW